MNMLRFELLSPWGGHVSLCVNGGSKYNAQRASIHDRTLKQERQAAYRGQSYGVDIYHLMTGFELSWRQATRRLCYFWSNNLFAPCAGKVVDTLNNKPDMVFQTADNIAARRQPRPDRM